MPSPFLLMTLGASLALPVADKVPHFDIRASCESVAKIEIAEAQSPESCIRDEETARAELEKKWHSFPAAERSQCEGETRIGGNPSYVEVLVCLQMTEEAKALNLKGAKKK